MKTLLALLLLSANLHAYSLHFEWRQDNWEAQLEWHTEDDFGNWVYSRFFINGNSVGLGGSQSFYGVLPPSLLGLHEGINTASTVPLDQVNNPIGPMLTAEFMFTIPQGTRPETVPDGGASALLLALGIAGMFGIQRHG